MEENTINQINIYYDSSALHNRIKPESQRYYRHVLVIITVSPSPSQARNSDCVII